MARPLRIAYPGAFYHITSRGNEQKTVFKNIRDREKFLEYSISLKKDSRGMPIGFRSIVRDITDRKQVEEALRESEKKIARYKKMESLGLLAGGVAHDLNNILSGIVSYPELILMDLPQDSKLRNPIRTMQEAGNRATAIVQDLLTVARGVAITKEPLNLNDLIDEYLHSPEFNKLQQFSSAVAVKANLDTDLFNISGSRSHIMKAVMYILILQNGSEKVSQKISIQ